MSVFRTYTPEDAPDQATGRLLQATRDHLGFLPVGAGRMATSPELLANFQRLTVAFDSTTLDPLAREVMVLAVATRNGCELCVAMHTGRLVAIGADPDLIATLRAGTAPADPRLAAVHRFTLAALDGKVDATDLYQAGYTPRQALELALGIGTYVMSTVANKLTDAPVDEPLAAYGGQYGQSGAA